jgi:hypothetical protein
MKSILALVVALSTAGDWCNAVPTEVPRAERDSRLFRISGVVLIRTLGCSMVRSGIQLILNRPPSESYFLVYSLGQQ